MLKVANPLGFLIDNEIKSKIKNSGFNNYSANSKNLELNELKGNFTGINCISLSIYKSILQYYRILFYCLDKFSNNYLHNYCYYLNQKKYNLELISIKLIRIFNFSINLKIGQTLMINHKKNLYFLYDYIITQF